MWKFFTDHADREQEIRLSKKKRISGSVVEVGIQIHQKKGLKYTATTDATKNKLMHCHTSNQAER